MVIAENKPSCESHCTIPNDEIGSLSPLVSILVGVGITLIEPDRTFNAVSDTVCCGDGREPPVDDVDEANATAVSFCTSLEPFSQDNDDPDDAER